MIDDLQTLCVAALRRHYQPSSASAGNGDDDDDDDNSLPSGQLIKGSSQPPLMVLDEIFECARMVDKPLLQIEAVRALAGGALLDCLDPEQRKAIEIRALFRLIDSSDLAVCRKALAVLKDIVNSPSEARRSLVLRPLVRGVMGDDSAAQAFSTQCFVDLLSVDHDPPIQRVLECGVVNRFLEFLQRRDDNPDLQCRAMRALTIVVVARDDGSANRARAGRDEAAIVEFVRLLGSSHDPVKEQAAEGLAGVAGTSCELRDVVLRTRAVPALVAELGRQASSSALGKIRSCTWALYALCRGTPRPDFAQIRPALLTLARLVRSRDELVLVPACRALSCLTDGRHQVNHQVEAIIAEAPGVCAQFVTLLRHPNPGVQLYVHGQGKSHLLFPLTPAPF
jgi:hypothetical protein